MVLTSLITILMEHQLVPAKLITSQIKQEVAFAQTTMLEAMETQLDLNVGHKVALLHHFLLDV